MLLKDFYTITDQTVEANTQHTTIRLNPAHAIFRGHFPSNPVTPGVCMLQIIKELAEQKEASSLQLKKATNVKFLAVINPEKTPDLVIQNTYKYTADEIIVKSSSSFGDTTALKVTVTYTKQ